MLLQSSNPLLSMSTKKTTCLKLLYAVLPHLWEPPSCLFKKIKKDRILHLCISCRELSQITISNQYPLPLILELLDLTKQLVFSLNLTLSGSL